MRKRRGINIRRLEVQELSQVLGSKGPINDDYCPKADLLADSDNWGCGDGPPPPPPMAVICE